MTWVTRARVIPSRRAMAAWLGASPDASRACHSMALRTRLPHFVRRGQGSSTTRGVRGGLGRLGLPPRRRDGRHHLVGGHPARLPAEASAQADQAAHIAVLEGPLACLPRREASRRRQGPEGDLDRLLAVPACRVAELRGAGRGGHGRAFRAVPACACVHRTRAGRHDDVDDAEPDLGLGEAGPAVSRPVHSGSRVCQFTNLAGITRA